MLWGTSGGPLMTRSRSLSVALTALAALVLGAFVVAVPRHNAAAASTLDQLAKAAGKAYFGSATDNPELSDAPYVSILGSEFGQLTPSNSMKWQTTEPNPGQFNFAGGDAIVNLARSRQQTVRGHTLVWHSQLAGWVSGLPANQVQAAMERHVTQQVTHYRGQLYAWDVVNEPFNEDGSFRSSPFFNAMGSAFVADALRTARAADPAVKLYLNDFNIEGINAKSDAMFNLARTLKTQGVPLDGVGVQGHFIVGQVPGTLRQNLQRFADLGLDVSITELDVRMQLPRTAAKDTQQRTDYQNSVAACVAVTRCVGVTVWDYTDKYSWVPGTFQGQGAATPWDESLNRKIAYDGIVTALGGQPTTPPSTTPPTMTPPTTTPAPGGAPCRVGYTVNNQWNTGFTTAVTITNTGTAPISGWRLVWTFTGGQTVANGWNGAFTQNATQVSVTNADWNRVIAPGARADLGFNGNHTGTNPAPSAFTVNGTACSLG
jgi:endo-1,4-beta-xylanase